MPIDEEEMAYDGKWFNGEVGKWAKLGDRQVCKLAEHMKFVHENSIKTNPQGIETAKSYSWRNSAKKIREVLENV